MKIIFLFILLIISFDCISQSYITKAKIDSANSFYALANVEYTNKNYRKADSLYTISIHNVPSSKAFFYRGICRGKLENMKGYCQDMRVSSYLQDTTAARIECNECFKSIVNYLDDDGNITDNEKHSYRDEYKIFRYEKIVIVKKIKRFVNESTLQYFAIMNKKDTFWMGGIKVPNSIKLYEDKSNVDVDMLPEFPGGMDALYKYFIDAIQFPSSALYYHDFDGTIPVSFVIDENGFVDEVIALKELKGGLTEEAARGVLFMPRWKPGFKDGKPARTNFTIPIKFKIIR